MVLPQRSATSIAKPLRSSSLAITGSEDISSHLSISYRPELTKSAYARRIGFTSRCSVLPKAFGRLDKTDGLHDNNAIRANTSKCSLYEVTRSYSATPRTEEAR